MFYVPEGFSTKTLCIDLNQIFTLKKKTAGFLENSLILISRIKCNIPEYRSSSSAAALKNPQISHWLVLFFFSLLEGNRQAYEGTLVITRSVCVCVSQNLSFILFVYI